MHLTNEQFALLWNASSTIDDVIAVTQQTRQGAAMKASRLRKAGFELKMMPCHRVRSIGDRFWSMVDKGDDCWVWTGSVNKKGYGQIATKRGCRPLQAHRLSFEMHFGQVPDGLMVLHRCDNPPCVRPEHLFTGTAKENTEDMIRKGRGHWQQKVPA